MGVPPQPDCAITQAPNQLTVTPHLLVPRQADSVHVQQTLFNYYNAINSSDYQTVIQQYSTTLRAKFTPEALADSLATSIDYDVVVHTVTTSGDGADAWVTFVSVQAPRFGPEGESCTEWSLDYGFAPSGDRLLINRVDAHDGDGHAPC